VTDGLRDSNEIDAIRTDRYLESLRAGSAAVAPDPSVGLAADRLGRELIRVHPSFRFEERLARRLADVAASLRERAAAGAEGAPIPLLPFPLDPGLDPADASLDPEGRRGAVPRPLIVGGAVASAALSIAGAAIVAWRLGRPPLEPLGRVIRLPIGPRAGGGPGGLP
jgi:hypothetical protein